MKDILKKGEFGQDYNDTIVEIIEVGSLTSMMALLKDKDKDAHEEMLNVLEDTDNHSEQDSFYLTSVAKDNDSVPLKVGELALYPCEYDYSNYWGIDKTNFQKALKITDVIGNVKDEEDRITDKNVCIFPWSKFDLENSVFDGEVELDTDPYGSKPEGFEVKYVSIKKEKYTSTGVAILIYKDGEPIIMTSHNGDERGYKFFNDTFIISGHDGSYLFNLNNHHEFASM